MPPDDLFPRIRLIDLFLLLLAFLLTLHLHLAIISVSDLLKSILVFGLEVPSLDHRVDRSLMLHVRLDQLPLDAVLENALPEELVLLGGPFGLPVRHYSYE
jgi:hypothetical protein